jgi:hypothetical protein
MNQGGPGFQGPGMMGQGEQGFQSRGMMGGQDPDMPSQQDSPMRGRGMGRRRGPEPGGSEPKPDNN